MLNKVLLYLLISIITLQAQEAKDCDSSCCKSSKDIIEKNNYTITANSECPEGYTLNMLKCIDSLKWCEPQKSNCMKLGEGETLGGIPDPGGWSTNCCPNLVNRDSKDDCELNLVGGYSYVCINCGDKVCDQKYESKCNCPEDCS